MAMVLVSTRGLKECIRTCSKNNVKADLGDGIHGSEEVLDKDDGEVVTSHTHRVSNQARAMESETRAQFS